MTVEFGEAVSAFASSLIAARRALDAATAELADVYDADERLRSLPVPAFSLAEATLDVPYVVDSVVEREPPRLDLPRRPVRQIGERELASLLRGAGEESRQRLQRLLNQYEKLSSLYQHAVDDPEILIGEQLPTLERLTRADLEALRSSASAAAREQLDALVDDAQSLHKFLQAAVARAKPTQQIFIRLDADSLADVPPERIQRATLTFRDVQTSTVDAGGEPVVVPE